MFLKSLIDLLFPTICTNCRKIIARNSSLCTKCLELIDFLSDHRCWGCGSLLTVDSELCASCLTSELPFASINSVFAYDSNSSSMIIRFKFFDDLTCAKIFSNWIYSRHQAILTNSDIIIPVPLHRKRLFVRKYNQSGLLAKHLSTYSKIPVDFFSLKRIRDTVQQTSLPRTQREKNVKNAFAISHKDAIKNQKIVLVDDVITTGSTIKSCARLLIKSGAKEVNVLTVARTVP